MLVLFVFIVSACTTATVPSALPLAPAPWEANTAVAAPQVLLDEWGRAENRESCAPMTIADPGPQARGGTARRANFSGGWGVAWDVPGLPGRAATGHPCETCGRGVYGIAGAGIVWGADEGNVGFPHRLDFAGGNWAGYALEGMTGPNWLAQVRVAGQPCVYYVWSFVGREHVEHLIRNVRRAAQ